MWRLILALGHVCMRSMTDTLSRSVTDCFVALTLVTSECTSHVLGITEYASTCNLQKHRQSVLLALGNLLFSPVTSSKPKVSICGNILRGLLTSRWSRYEVSLAYVVQKNHSARDSCVDKTKCNAKTHIGHQGPSLWGDMSPQLLDRAGHNIFCQPNILWWKVM